MAKLPFIILVLLLSVSIPSYAMVAHHPVFTIDESEPNKVIQQKRTQANKAYKKGDYETSYNALKEVHDIYFRAGSDLQIAASDYQLATILQDLGYEQKAKIHFKDALTYLEKALNPKGEFYLGRLAVMSNIYYQLTQLQSSLESYNQLIDLLDEDNDKHRTLLANSLANRAAVWYDLNQIKNAEHDALKALALQEEVISKDDSINAAMLHNLGLFYHNQGLYSKALNFYKRAIKKRKQSYKDNHPKIATTLQQMSLVYSAQYDYKQAISHQQRVIAIYAGAFGKHNPSVANSINGLANIYMTQKDFKKANENYQMALNVLKSKLKDLDPNIGMVLYNLGSLYSRDSYSKGDNKKAQKHFQLALEHYLAFAKESEKQIGNTYLALANINIEINNMDLAKSQLEKADKAFAANQYPKGRTEVKQSLGYLFSSQGKYQQAIELYLQTLSEFKTINNALKQDIARSHQQLAYCYYQQSQYEQAVASASSAIELYKPLKSEHYESLLVSHINLGLSYAQLDKNLLSLSHQQHALEIVEQYFSADKKRYAEALVAVARAQNRVNDTKQAISTYHKALSLYKQVKPKVDQEVAEIHFNLAQISLNQNDNKTAKRYFELAIAYYEIQNNSEQDEGDLLTAYHNLAYILSAQKQYKQAYDIGKKHLAKLQEKNNKPLSAEFDVLFSLAFSASQLNLSQKAIAHYQAIISATDKQSKKPEMYGKVLHNLAILLQNDKQYDQAVTVLNLQLKDSDTPEQKAKIHRNLGQVYAQLQQIEQSNKYYQLALNYYGQYDDLERLKEVEWISHNLAIHFHNQKDYKHSQQYFEQALGANIELTNVTDFSNAQYMTGLAYAMLEQKDYASSKQVYEEALVLFQIQYPKGHETIEMINNNLSFIEQNLR